MIGQLVVPLRWRQAEAILEPGDLGGGGAATAALEANRGTGLQRLLYELVDQVRLCI